MDNEVKSMTEGLVEELVGTPKDQEVEITEEDEFEKPVEPEIDDSVEESIEKEEEQTTPNNRKIIKGIIITLCSLIVFYCGMTAYFMNRYYFGSEINCINVSGKTLEAAEELIESELQNYTLTLRKRGGEIEQIKAADVGLGYTSYEELKKLKDSQNPFGWILAFLGTKDSKIEIEVSFDEKLLEGRLDKLSCFDETKIIEPRNPSFQYSGNSYVIIDEVPGNKVGKGALISLITNALINKEAEIDLESSNCYVKPQYTSESHSVLEAKNTLDKYASSEIIYTIGSNKEVIGGNTINKWLTVDENYKVIINDSKIREYINHLAEKYDTTGKTRDFNTSSGSTIQIGGGDFGRVINKSKEIENLISDIKAGRKINREPAYSQTVFSQSSSDIADTYVEIDMTQQYIWFYKNGSLIVEGDIVTGNVKAGHTTPKGVYRLKHKAKDVVLRGPGYAAPVTFWMPFNRGIGIHDASWRNVFGGTIYKTAGSHGCINCPYNVAKEIYNNIELGTPVICY